MLEKVLIVVLSWWRWCLLSQRTERGSSFHFLLNLLIMVNLGSNHWKCTYVIQSQIGLHYALFSRLTECRTQPHWGREATYGPWWLNLDYKWSSLISGNNVQQEAWQGMRLEKCTLRPEHFQSSWLSFFYLNIFVWLFQQTFLDHL